MSELCQHTIKCLSSIDSIPGPLLNNAAAELAESEYNRETRFDDKKIGQNLCGKTVLAVCEQLFRFRVCPDLLGLILDGVYGRILSTMMISATYKVKKRRQNEGKEKSANMAEHKTKFGVPRNLRSEIETIHSTGMCLLHSAVESLRFIVPISTGETIRSVKGMSGGRVWQSFFGLDTMTGEEVEFSAHMDDSELSLLGEIITHNEVVGPNRWQFCLFPCREAELVSELFGRDVITIRRVKSSLRSALSSCIMAAFGAAAFRFLVLEFGHKTELPKGMIEHRTEKFAYKAPEMLAIDFRDEIESKASDLQMQMIRVAMEEPADSPDEVLDILNRQIANPISRATFWRNWTPLVKLCKDIVID